MEVLGSLADHLIGEEQVTTEARAGESGSKPPVRGREREPVSRRLAPGQSGTGHTLKLVIDKLRKICIEEREIICSAKWEF